MSPTNRSRMKEVRLRGHLKSYFFANFKMRGGIDVAHKTFQTTFQINTKVFAESY